MAIIPLVASAAALVQETNKLIGQIRGGSRGNRPGTRTSTNLTKLRRESEAADTALREESEAADTALAQLLAMVEQESQEADEALAAHLSAVTQQQASLARWLLFVSIGVVIVGMLAAAAMLGLVITIAVLA